MLQVLNTTIEREVQPPLIERRRYTLTGRQLAQFHDDPRTTACRAALWALGTLSIVPATVPQATRLFPATSTNLIHEELRRLKAQTYASSLLEHSWAKATAAEREQFIRRYQAQIFTMLDRMTA